MSRDDKEIAEVESAAPVDFQFDDPTVSRFEKVELVWPGKDVVGDASQHANGRWQLAPTPDRHRIYPIVDLASHPEETGSTSLAILGDRLSALRTLARSARRSVRFAYVDAPRIGIDNSDVSFQGEGVLLYSSWLSVVRLYLEAIEPLLRRDGIVAIHVGETEAGFARMVADELFRGQHVGTIVWQRAYAPRNMKGMREFTSTHDCILIYAKQRDALPPVGLRRAPAGYANSDGDPRGDWKAEHKGAKSKRAKSDFDTYVPPYRWRVIEGALPEGLWRVSPLTGVLWGKPTTAGTFNFTVEASDSAGKTTARALSITVLPEGTPRAAPEIPWLFREIETSGPLVIQTEALPDAVLGATYNAIVLAAGGKPYIDAPKRPGSGRYWEFAIETLLKAYQCDSVYLGKDKPAAIPHPKTYAEDVGDVVVENQQTWWPGRIGEGKKSTAFAGYTEDATKHLKALKELSLIESESPGAKPEHLLARLLDIFTDRGDLVLEAFGSAADMSAVAIKRDRRFLLLAGSSEHDLKLFTQCGEPRLKAVVNGSDTGLDERVSEIRMRKDAYSPYEGGGGFRTGQLGEWIIERGRRDDLSTLNVEEYSKHEDLGHAILTAEGYIPVDGEPYGVSAFQHSSAAVAVPPDEFLTLELSAEWVGRLSERFSSVVLYYFRSAADFDPTLLADGVIAKRVPFEMGV
jgi:hypothetical protein